MKIPRWLLGVAVASALSVALPARLLAQGVTTGAIAGTVTDGQGHPVEAAQVQIVNRSTGFTSGSLTRANGYYFVQGLEVGSNYTVRIRRIGFEPVERNNIPVSLSQTTRVDIQLATQAVQLTGVQVVGTTTASTFSPTRQGVSTEVSDTLISRIPNLSRNFTDLVKLTPQVSIPSSGGPSAGGQYNRYNSFNIDGASQNDRFNLGSSGGQPGAAGNGRIISSEAVKEFRVLMSPTDVRQANFTGMSVNAVTKSGTNEFHGSALYNFRNEDFSATNFRDTKLDVKQYGFTLGGPIIKDKLHFFVAPEWQQRTSGAAGAFVGQTGASTGTTLNIDPDSIAYVQSIIQNKIGFDPGTAGRIDIDNPLTNLFGRVDWQIDGVNRLVLRQLYNKTDNVSFSRNTRTFNNSPNVQNQGFRLGSNAFTGRNTNSSTVGQLYSNFSNGWSNEFISGFNQIRDQRIVPVVTPEMSVGVVPSDATGTATTNPTAVITFGTEQFSVGNQANQDILELQDNFSLPWNTHTFTFGGRFEHVKVYNNFAQASGGVWVFPNIAALNNLQPSGYRVAYANSGNPADIPASFRTNQSSLYAQDQWAVTPNLTITGGLRADIPSFQDKPSENSQISDLFAAKGIDIHTSWTPKTQILWSPRLGFNWDITGRQETQLRGNVGVFTGPPPFILVANGYQNTGLGLVTLSCTGANTPAFTIDVSNLPKSCANQPAPAPGSAGTAGINLTDPNLKYPQSFVTSLGFDHRLPWDVVATVEGLYRKNFNDVWVRDLNLVGPKLDGQGNLATDVNGRVLYADSLAVTNGNAVIPTNSPLRAITRYNGVNFTEGAIYVTNQSKSYNYTLTGQLKKRFGMGLDLTAAYTYNQAYDVQSLTSDRAISNWRNGREYSGLESEPTLTHSAFERPHRFLTYGTYTMPWTKNWQTDVTLYYERISGTPITYVSSLDLNGDGYAGNDPIYVPTNATDPNEIKIGTMTPAGVFTPDVEGAQDFEKFISSQDCLNEQRGHIMKRNSCRNPAQNRLDFSLRQGIPEIRGQRLAVQLDVINFAALSGELFNHAFGGDRDWGKNYGATLSSFPQQTVLSGSGLSNGTRVSRTPGPTAQSMPVYTFNSTVRSRGPYDFASNIGYQMQLTFRYDF